MWHDSFMENLLSSSVTKSFLAGTISGTCSTLLLQPFDVIKTRIQTPNFAGSKPVRMIGVCRDIIYQDKLWGLWKGTVPSLVKCVPGIGLYFCSLQALQSVYGSSKPNNAELLMLGATARSFVAVTVLPFTVIKVRFESGLFKYGGVMNAIRSIYTHEGAKGLYSGLAATLVRDVPYSSLYLMFYTNIKTFLISDSVQHSHPSLLKFPCGVLAGLLASVITQPADVIKTLMQLNSNKYPTTYSAVKQVYKASGIKGFFAGIIPRTVRRTLITALSWTVYEHLMIKLGLTSKTSTS